MQDTRQWIEHQGALWRSIYKLCGFNRVSVGSRPARFDDFFQLDEIKIPMVRRKDDREAEEQ